MYRVFQNDRHPLYSNIEGLSEYGVKTFFVGLSNTILLAQTPVQNLIPILRKSNFRKNRHYCFLQIGDNGLLSEIRCFKEIIW